MASAKQSISTFHLEFSRSAKARARNPEVNRQYIVPVLLKAVRILELVRSSSKPLRVQDIHRLTGISRSTVYRVLRTFIVSGHLQQTRDGRYTISEVLDVHAERHSIKNP